MGHKILEVYDGSRLLIKMKCANEFKCKHKKNCNRINKIKVGSIVETKMIEPICALVNKEYIGQFMGEYGVKIQIQLSGSSDGKG